MGNLHYLFNIFLSCNVCMFAWIEFITIIL